MSDKEKRRVDRSEERVSDEGRRYVEPMWGKSVKRRLIAVQGEGGIQDDLCARIITVGAEMLRDR